MFESQSVLVVPSNTFHASLLEAYTPLRVTSPAGVVLLLMVGTRLPEDCGPQAGPGGGGGGGGGGQEPQSPGHEKQLSPDSQTSLPHVSGSQ